jgi:hypothetical protein
MSQKVLASQLKPGMAFRLYPFDSDEEGSPRNIVENVRVTVNVTYRYEQPNCPGDLDCGCGHGEIDDVSYYQDEEIEVFQ